MRRDAAACNPSAVNDRLLLPLDVHGMRDTLQQYTMRMVYDVVHVLGRHVCRCYGWCLRRRFMGVGNMSRESLRHLSSVCILYGRSAVWVVLHHESVLRRDFFWAFLAVHLPADVMVVDLQSVRNRGVLCGQYVLRDLYSHEQLRVVLDDNELFYRHTSRTQPAVLLRCLELVVAHGRLSHYAVANHLVLAVHQLFVVRGLLQRQHVWVVSRILHVHRRHGRRGYK
jgi:hypothetical protein